MCGIFGYVGSLRKNLSGFIVDGLSKLEYRGYDSAGIAIPTGDNTLIYKQVGEIKELQKILKDKRISGSLGIGHTRWATHGGVTVKNAHPHTDCSGSISVVHNGIIENFEDLKVKLIASGHEFVSETDTEVFAHLVEEKAKKNSFEEAVRKAFLELKGLNAVVAINSDMIVAFRFGSPLVAGKKGSSKFVSSDIPALSFATDQILLLEENEGVVLKKESFLLIDAETGKTKKPRFSKLEMRDAKVLKNGYKHYLLKEIYEQPDVLHQIAMYDHEKIKIASRMIRDAWGTYFSACGTASYAGLAANYVFADVAKKHVNYAVASEFPYFENFLVRDSLLIVASQSGETMDTLEAVRAAKRHDSKILSLVNVPGSTLARLSDYSLYLGAGPERAVLSTKSYVAKLALFTMLAFTLDGGYSHGKKKIQEVAQKTEELLSKSLEREIKHIAKKIFVNEHVYVIGRGVNYATALEGALKIKEASYIHAEGIAGGELKHGPIALIEEGTPVISVVANDKAKDAIISNTIELKSRGAYVIGISPENHDSFDEWIMVPEVEYTSPIVNIIPIQLLAYHLALLKGINPDKPRNLAKSVTVK